MKAFSKISKAPLLIWMPDGLSSISILMHFSQLSVPLNGILTWQMHIKLVVYSSESYSVWKLYAFCCWPLEVFPPENLANYDWWTKPRREHVKPFSFSTNLLSMLLNISFHWNTTRRASSFLAVVKITSSILKFQFWTRYFLNFKLINCILKLTRESQNIYLLHFPQLAISSHWNAT